MRSVALPASMRSAGLPASRRAWQSISTGRRPARAALCRRSASDYRRIGRWEHEAVLDKMQGRLDVNPEAMQMRRQTVEHPFGTIKAWMGATHFLCRRLPRVSAEMSLHVLAYNLKRVMKIMG